MNPAFATTSFDTYIDGLTVMKSSATRFTAIGRVISSGFRMRHATLGAMTVVQRLGKCEHAVSHERYFWRHTIMYRPNVKIMIYYI